MRTIGFQILLKYEIATCENIIERFKKEIVKVQSETKELNDRIDEFLSIHKFPPSERSKHFNRDHIKELSDKRARKKLKFSIYKREIEHYKGLLDRLNKQKY